MNASRLWLWLLASIFCMAAALRAGPPTPDKSMVTNPDRDDRFSFAYETSINLGIDNPNNYIINPQILEVRWQPFHAKPFFNTPFVFVQEFAFGAAAVAFLQGPEHHYFGLGVGPRWLYTKPGSHWSIHFDGRLYAGFIDSSGPPHGQGQDLTFMPTVNGGVLYAVSPRQEIGLSLFYEHFSNAGMSEPERHNVGLNSVGPMFEYNVSF